MATTKRIKFIKAWMMVPAGAEREFEAPIADLLIKNGRAREVQTPTPAPAPKKAPKKPTKKRVSNADR